MIAVCLVARSVSVDVISVAMRAVGTEQLLTAEDIDLRLLKHDGKLRQLAHHLV